MEWHVLVRLNGKMPAKVVPPMTVWAFDLHWIVTHGACGFISPSFSSKRWRYLTQTWSHWPIGVCRRLMSGWSKWMDMMKGNMVRCDTAYCNWQIYWFHWQEHDKVIRSFSYCITIIQIWATPVTMITFLPPMIPNLQVNLNAGRDGLHLDGHHSTPSKPTPLKPTATSALSMTQIILGKQYCIDWPVPEGWKYC